MIPSANPTAHQTGDLAWHSTAAIWPDQAAATASLQRSGLDSRHFSLNRQQILEWENAMLLAQHSNTHCSVYDQETDHKPTINMQAEATGSIANSRQYDGGLLSGQISSSGLSQNTWELFNTLGARRSGGAVGLHREGSLTQTSSSPYNPGSLGASPMGGYSSFQGGNGVSGLYGDPLSAARSSVFGLTSFDQRRLEDIVKRELYATQDFNSMLGLNLGGRTYFSADDYAFSWLGKRLRPMSPSMIQAPLCQAEGCKSDLNMAKHYHRRHKVCEYHSKAATVNTGGGQTQRFCQQCSRFHVLSEFDDGKRSCRKRLADHNRRRRKPQPVSSLAIAEKAKESEEGAGSESLQNGGGQSSKGSPTVGEQPLALASEHNESGKRQSMQVSEESMDKTQQEEAQTSKNFKLGSAIASNTIAPGLSLVAQHDKQAANGCEPRFSAADDKLAVPLLQASTNNQLMEASYSTKSDHNSESSGEGDHHHHAEKVASIHSSIQNLLPTASPDHRNIENSRSWVMKSVAAAAQGSDQMGDRHINQINHRLSGKSGGGGHEVLRLMVGDEIELAGTKRAMHASSTVENLGGFGHQASLSKGQNIINFSSLQKQQADNLTRPLSKSSIFGSHSHHAHNNML